MSKFTSPEERARIKAARREENRRLNLIRQEEGKFGKKETTARAPISTEKGQKQRMAEFRQQLLHAPTADTIIRKILTIALDDEHPGQMAAMKMCVDRMLPVSMFEEKKAVGDKPIISINITGIGEQPKLIEEAIDGDA